MILCLYHLYQPWVTLHKYLFIIILFGIAMPLSKQLLNLCIKLKQFFNYCFVGAFVNGLAYLIYLFATRYNMPPKATMTLLYVACVFTSIMAHHKWTFQNKNTFRPILIRAIIAYISGYLINLLLLYFLVDRYSFPHQLIQFLAIGIVSIYLFFVFKLFVFSNSPRNHEMKWELRKN